VAALTRVAFLLERFRRRANPALQPKLSTPLPRDGEMAENFPFTDKKRRTITFEVDDGGVIAYHNEKRIGELTQRVVEEPLRE
jgi:hypothetical protein